METVAFYSYKGGVGRSLLLANAARFLATLGKRVVALDFDFEAPGLHYKLGAGRDSDSPLPGGAVLYLNAIAEGTESLPALEEHTTVVPVPPGSEGWLRLMPAGPAPHQKYWTAFKELGDRLQLTDPSGQGFMAVLDLQARIADDLKPDYLLIDARTGVTELGSLATTTLADTVVCMFVANQESLDGTVTVVEALKASPRLKGQQTIRVLPVLSRSATVPEDERFKRGVKRLLELGEGKASQNNKESTLFVLPHDDAIAVSEKVVGGERRASAFSPLYKSYLELFETLFPSSAQGTRSVLERLQAVAGIKEELTRVRDSHREFSDMLPPWDESAIQEGVIYRAERQRGKGERFADLVCRNDRGQALMVVEYTGDEASSAEALTFWKDSTSIRCAVLVTKANYGSQREIFTRPADHGELHAAERRWDLPRPREFELLRDVGDRSVESMLDALRHGHIEAVAWLINEWEDSTTIDEGPKRRRGHWRPERAQRILDGLAATEDVRCAEEILRRASSGGYERWRNRRRYRDDFFHEEDFQKSLEDLYAPLFWRLPVEAVVESMEARHYPGETPSLAGYRLLAQELMGLVYDPDRVALEEARSRAERWSPTGSKEDDDQDERAMMWLHRSRRERIRRFRLSEDPPPALILEEVFREEPHWQGTLEEARDKVGDKVKKLMESSGGLRNRLKRATSRRELAVQGLLGSYQPLGRVELYVPVISAVADVIGLSSRSLKSVVFIHLSAWALAHEARDLDGQVGYGFAPAQRDYVSDRESPTHVALVQAFSDCLIRRLKDPNIQAAFEKLAKYQPEPYRHWTAMRQLPLEELRQLLLKARSSPPALGLPSTRQNE